MSLEEDTDTQGNGLLDDGQIADLLGSTQHTVDLPGGEDDSEPADTYADPESADLDKDTDEEPVDAEDERAGLRQADYTKKTQGLASDRRAFEAEKAAWNEARRGQDNADAPDEPGSTAPDPELAKTEPARYLEELVDYRAAQQVGGLRKEIDELRGALDEERRDLAPIRAQQAVVEAYRGYQGENPSLDHKALGPAVGKLLETDPDLGEMAVTNPGRAVRLAARLVQAESQKRASRTTTSRRKAAAPVAARRGGSVATAPPASDLTSAFEYAYNQLTR